MMGRRSAREISRGLGGDDKKKTSATIDQTVRSTDVASCQMSQ